MDPLFGIPGGIGLFLFGMAAMTSGLRHLAGDRLRQWLATSTRNTASGVLTGATVTALIQSSSATTIAAIGFVAAGALTFSQSLGIIFGANIGTTITGWMVTLIGFRFKLATAVLPLILIGAFCYLLKSNRVLRGIGKAICGFCLIFIGISFLQEGLEDYRDLFDLSRWQAASFGGRIILVLVGVLFTIVTQSSSATVATAITALNTSLIDLPQAAAVIIGADIGTTVTAALATIGGTTAARRTGFAHVIYNLMTGAAAFLILPAYLWCLEKVTPETINDSPEMVAVGFHSFFNILGVILILPFTTRFGQFIEKIFPETTPPLAAPFDPGMLGDRTLATDSLELGSKRLAREALTVAASILGKESGGSGPKGGLDAILSAVDRGRNFAMQLGQGGLDESDVNARRILAAIHILDHIERLCDRLLDHQRAVDVFREETLAGLAGEIPEKLRSLAGSLDNGESIAEPAGLVEGLAMDLDEDKRRFRQHLIEAAGTRALTGDDLDAALDAHRWLRRVTYHAGRIGHYASQSRENP